jgi:hypothetical protein
MRPFVATAIAALAFLIPAVHGQVVFRSNADEVLVDVSVMRGKSPVTGLTAADFVLTDNGVRQTLREVSRNSGDIDVTLVLQREGVLSDVIADPGGRTVRIRNLTAGPAIDLASSRIRRLIQPADGLRVLSADDDVRFGATTSKSGRSMILDGLTAAMMLKPTSAGRRQLIIGVTAGVDDRSFVLERSRLNVALRTDAVVHIVALGDGRPAYVTTRSYGTNGRLLTEYGAGVAGASLKPIADATGGRLFQVEPGADPQKILEPAVEEFRTRYLLRYAPTGVPREGWHDIVVTVPAGSFEVRHRRGYEIGGR